MEHYGLLVIGAGPGGYEAALRAAKLGIRTAVVESRDVGGTCLNRGCIPTKSLLHAAEIAAGLERGREWGISAESLSVDFAAVHRKKTEVTEKLRAGVEGLLRQKKVSLLRGTGTILTQHRVLVNGTEYEADHILIATGSVPARPPIPGLEHAVTSDEVLSDQERVYRSLVIIGGGVIGVELACVYQAMGCQVTIVEAMDRILPNMDREICQNMTMILKRRGAAVHTGCMVSAVEKDGDGLAVRYTCKDQPGEARGEAVLCAIGRRPNTAGGLRGGRSPGIGGGAGFGGGRLLPPAARGEAVLCAIGRRPNTAGLFGEGFAVDMERGRILVDDHFQTSVPGVYAIGDVSSRIQLAHVAAAQGVACAERLAGREPLVDAALVPSCIYTSPEIAAIGITADEAKAAGRAVKVGKALMSANGKTLIAGGERGFIKVVADAETGVILGAQLMCERATDMLSQFTEAAANGLTARQLARVMRPHPTFEEAVSAAVEDLLEKLEK